MPKNSFTDHPFAVAVRSRIGELMSRRADSPPATGLVAGLSGGPDSVALLLAAKTWADETGAPLAGAHFNHLLRPGDAEADAEFCRALCAETGVPLFEDAGDPRPVARKRGLGLEEAARHLRRRFFDRILRDNPAFGWVATGHHRDDQVETVLMRLFRGTGPDGLRGIRPLSGRVIHPLLAFGRAEIVSFLEDCGQPWRTDATNLDGGNVRARIRRELLPLARGIFGPGSADVPARLAELLDRDMELLETVTREALAGARHPGHAEDLAVSRLLALDRGLGARVLRLWLEDGPPSGIERVHIESVLDWLESGQSGTGLDLPGNLRVHRDFDRLSLRTGSRPAPPRRGAEDYRIVVTRNSPAPADRTEEIETGVGAPGDPATWRLTCPAACLRGNLKVRNPLAGDRFQPFGLDGSKKLSDLLRENRVARGLRPGVLVVADEAGILWVVGVARAERTRLLPSTGQTVTLTVVERSETSDS